MKDWSSRMVRLGVLMFGALCAGTVLAQIPPTTGPGIVLGIATGGSVDRPAPSLATWQVFEARPPYVVQTRKGPVRVRLGMYNTRDDVLRRFDFVGPFLDTRSSRTNYLTAQAPVQAAGGLRFENLSDTTRSPQGDGSSPRRVEFNGSELTIAYRAYDPPSSEKVRAMINTWPVPTRQLTTWDLSFKLGTGLRGEEWPLPKPYASPVLLWQLKGDPGFPSMGILADTSTKDPSRYRLLFFQRLENRWDYSYRWEVDGLKPGEFVDVVIQTNLDDRNEGSEGKLAVWVNGRFVVERTGRNLIQEIPEVHRGAFGLYFTAEPGPLAQDRVSIWRRARLLVPSPSGTQ